MDYSLIVGIKKLGKRVLKDHLRNKEEGTSFFHTYNGGLLASYRTGEPYPIVYYLGIIDMLQPYSIKKKVEHALKRLRDSQQEISCVDPSTYAHRFVNFFRFDVNHLFGFY